MAPDLGNEDWSYGANTDYLRDLCDYWRNEFDWRAREKAINAHPHYRIEINGLPIHNLHIFKAQSVNDSTFFAASNYHTYVTRRPETPSK